jgi:ribosomal-protein-alanine N-acetyltransferase
MKVRAAGPGDVAEIVRLDSAAVEAAHWSEADYSAVLNLAEDVVAAALNLRRQIFVVEKDAASENLQGFLLVKCIVLAEQSLAEIENLAVDSTARRRGAGRALLAAALDWAREQGAERMQLEVRAGNEAALALYRAMAFCEVGRRPGYYSQPVEEAVLLDRILK